MKTTRLRQLFWGLMLFFFVAPIIRANESDSLRQYHLDSIVVSSIKLPHAAWRVPAASTTLNGNTLQRRQLNEMKDFTASIPNFIMIDRDSRLTSSVFVRGVGSLINAPGVAMYVDGIPHFEKSSFDINLADIEKIEFLRGPQGTLYGRNAMGGIILVHTASPFRRQGTRLRLSYGSHNETRITLSHRRKEGEQFAWGLTGDYHHTDGFIINRYNGETADKLNAATLSNRLEWRPRHNLSFRLQQSLEKVKQGAFGYGTVNSEGNDVDSVSLNHPSHYERLIYDAGLQADYHTPLVWFRAQSSLQLLDDTYEVDQDASPRDLYHALQGEKQRLLSQEINLRNTTEGIYGWNFGLFAFHHLIRRSTDVFLQMAKPPYQLEKRYDDRNSGIALYHQSELQITPRLVLEAGLRYDFEKAHSIHRENKLTGGTVELRNQYDSPLTFSQWTPKVTLQYRFNGFNQLYATWARGYKTGGFNTVFEAEHERTFDPEKSWNYEIGGKTTLFDRRLIAETALFYIDIRNQQVKQLLDLQGVKIRNAGRSISKGAELSLQILPSDAALIYLTYGYTHATFRSYRYSEEIDYRGNYLPFVPRHTLTVGAEQRINLRSSISDRLLLQASYTGMGERYWHEDNRVKQPFYGLLNASVAIEKGSLRLTLWGKNILNERQLGYYFESAGRSLGKPGKPFTTGVTFEYSI
ncbi:MAG TPA: TonB-dependent receptor [Proteiniphilum sp.]|nr:TonB-dependent receptor [Proteiniphilum sp.]HPJ50634.1 TonB-dependent receptor [Proteiniphilum sp.]HPR20050.1 TonB-dependent receptor [Proteiniphilum sp.]